MGKHIFIDGGLVATTGNLYARSISSGGSWHPEDAVMITPPGGWLEITCDMGSIFDSYYVSGPVACGGILGDSKGAIASFLDIYDFTVRNYEKGISQIQRMLEISVPETDLGLFLQEQYASVFSLLEYFLSCTFVRQTCDREDSYQRLLASGELLKRSTKELNSILNGPDCLLKELTFIEVANRIIYHNADRVGVLFKTAFDINVDLSILKKQLEVRHHIVHRFGHTKNGSQVSVSVNDVQTLIEDVDRIVRSTIDQILKLSPSERLYPRRD